MQPWAVEFYKSASWKKCREAYAKSQSYLCERCRLEGRITPGEIVHHRTPLTPTNITDPEITLNWDNLQLLCRDHHADAHAIKHLRYKIDELGHVTAI